MPRLIETGGQVRVYIRRDEPSYRSRGVKVAIGDADHEGRLESALEQVHTLVHLVGGPLPDRGVTVEWLNLDTIQVALRAAVNAEVRRVLFCSPVGADPAATHPYLAAAGRAEEAVRGSGLEHAILRCAPVLGPGSALAMLLERGVPSRRRSAKLNPVAVADVAAALASADTRDTEMRGTWDLGGPVVVTIEDLVARAGVRRGILSRAPGGLADLYARDSVADAEQAAAQFGLRLTPLDEALAGI